MELRIYNTLTRKVETFKPLEDKKVKYYTCGPTVYNYPHIGNFSIYIRQDFLKRLLEYLGYEVNHVMNITDIDDKIIKGLKRSGKDLKEFTDYYLNYFLENLKLLNIKMPTKIVRVTEAIDKIIELIKILEEKGYAYETEDGVYYDISKFKDYGKLSKLPLQNLKHGARINQDEYDKEELGDFALWKKSTPEELELGVYWESPWGKGRPGWHIECSAIALNYLGETIDIHSGGIDLIFPHHENEIAQSEAATGKEFCRYWVHMNHLLVNGEKMSKSLGNIITLEDLKNEGIHPMVYKLWVLSSHYRSQLNYTKESILQAEKNLTKIVIFLSKVKDMKDGDIEADVKSLKEKVLEHLCDDLDTPKAFAEIFKFIDEYENKKLKNGKEVYETFIDLDKIFGLNLEKLVEEIKDIPQEIIELAEKRKELRKQKNYTEADKIREELYEKGYIIEDIGLDYVIYKRIKYFEKSNN